MHAANEEISIFSNLINESGCCVLVLSRNADS